VQKKGRLRPTQQLSDDVGTLIPCDMVILNCWRVTIDTAAIAVSIWGKKGYQSVRSLASEILGHGSTPGESEGWGERTPKEVAGGPTVSKRNQGRKKESKNAAHKGCQYQRGREAKKWGAGDGWRKRVKERKSQGRVDKTRENAGGEWCASYDVLQRVHPGSEVHQSGKIYREVVVASGSAGGATVSRRSGGTVRRGRWGNWILALLA